MTNDKFEFVVAVVQKSLLFYTPSRVQTTTKVRKFYLLVDGADTFFWNVGSLGTKRRYVTEDDKIVSSVVRTSNPTRNKKENNNGRRKACKAAKNAHILELRHNLH